MRPFRLSLRLDGRAIRMDSRTDCLQGTLTETLGIALAGLRQHDNALGQGRANGVVAAGVEPSEASVISKAIPI